MEEGTVNCFECAKTSDSVPAVAMCDHCGEARAYRVGGTIWGCPHQLPAVKPLGSVPAGIAQGVRHTSAAR